jgi:hypothetical protein
LFQPAPWAVLTLVSFLASALAGAQPRPAARERQVVSNRQLVLPTNATGPVPEVRVAPGATTITFDAALARDSVKLDGEGMRIRRVDVGDQSVIVEPLVKLGAAAGALLGRCRASGRYRCPRLGLGAGRQPCSRESPHSIR